MKAYTIPLSTVHVKLCNRAFALHVCCTCGSASTSRSAHGLSPMSERFQKGWSTSTLQAGLLAVSEQMTTELSNLSDEELLRELRVTCLPNRNHSYPHTYGMKTHPFENTRCRSPSTRFPQVHYLACQGSRSCSTQTRNDASLGGAA